MTTNYNELTDLVSSNANAITMANGDRLYIAEGVLVGADSTTTTNYNGVNATGAIVATIDGTLSGSGIGFADTIGGNFITIGHEGVIESQSNQAGYAISITQGSNEIFNQGNIDGELRIQGSGSNYLQNSGTIFGDGFPVVLYGVTNQIENTGTIIGGASTNAAVEFNENASAGGNRLSNEGTISGSFGIEDHGVSANTVSINNSGSVQSSGGAAIIEYNAANLDVANSGTINAAGIGVDFNGAGGVDNITNGGSIFGQSTAVLENSSAALRVANSAAGVISGLTAIDDSNGTGAYNINNAGTIQGTGSVTIAIGSSAGSGHIINSGTISNGGYHPADVAIQASGTTNFIHNSGTISGNTAIVFVGTNDELINTGTILGSVADGTTNSFKVINSGHIVGNIGLAGNSDSYDGTLGTVSGVVIAGLGTNTLTGGAGSDTFWVQFGTDTADTGGGNDSLVVQANLANLTIDGGTGKDTVDISGTYANFVFTADTMVNVETLRIENGGSVKLTTVDETVAAGQSLAVIASALDATHVLTFDGSAETDGKFSVTGGAGNDFITTSVGNDVVNGGDGNDKLTPGSGNDTVSGGNGNDTIVFSTGFNAADKVDGGTGTDTVTLTGDYSGTAAVVLGTATMVNVETLNLGAGHSYGITTNNATVAAGQTLVVNASGLAATNTLTFNGAAEKDGHFNITGGKGADVLTGGALSDTFVYTSAALSSGIHHDTINSFSYSLDKFDITGTISAIDTKVLHSVSTASFDTDIGASASAAHLLAHTAMLVTANAGTLSGHTFLVVDLNGTAGYQVGHDLVIDMHSATGTLTTGDFI